MRKNSHILIDTLTQAKYNKMRKNSHQEKVLEKKLKLEREECKNRNKKRKKEGQTWKICYRDI